MLPKRERLTVLIVFAVVVYPNWMLLNPSSCTGAKIALVAGGCPLLSGGVSARTEQKGICKALRYLRLHERRFGSYSSPHSRSISCPKCINHFPQFRPFRFAWMCHYTACCNNRRKIPSHSNQLRMKRFCPSPEFPQHPELLHELGAIDIAAHEQVVKTGKRHWPVSHILRTMNGWMLPYIKIARIAW